jgi:hypothetical protein
MLVLVRTLFAATVAALALAAAAGAVDQEVIPYQPGSPTVNGCPAGSEALALSDLAKYPYHLPFVLDASGNGDGIVCGKPLSPKEQAVRFPEAPVPIVFDFTENGLKAAR